MLWKVLWPMIFGRCPPTRRCSTSSDKAALASSPSVGACARTVGMIKPANPHPRRPIQLCRRGMLTTRKRALVVAEAYAAADKRARTDLGDDRSNLLLGVGL